MSHGRLKPFLFSSLKLSLPGTPYHRRPRRTSPWPRLSPDPFECIRLDVAGAQETAHSINLPPLRDEAGSGHGPTKMSPGQGTRVEITQEDHEDGSIAVDALVRTRLVNDIRDDECSEEQEEIITAFSFAEAAVEYMWTANVARELRARSFIKDCLKDNYTKEISRQNIGLSQESRSLDRIC